MEPERRSTGCEFCWNELRMAFWMSFGKFKLWLSFKVEYAINFWLSLKVEYAVNFWLSLKVEYISDFLLEYTGKDVLCVFNIKETLSDFWMMGSYI
ncbi:hypothetical protein C1645_825831 [Glomus cerebriforme]|uniref:Uncharacterized protein n=1 Tax=Glomus cerebriforme TaxID=658196 RepID=A0A397SS34_9GLOM|nr:hypothetical protein C1645_825831 [Glomus cerebriforme]